MARKSAIGRPKRVEKSRLGYRKHAYFFIWPNRKINDNMKYSVTAACSVTLDYSRKRRDSAYEYLLKTDLTINAFEEITEPARS